MERVVSGRQFRSGKKGAPKSEKSSGAMERSGWWVVDGRGDPLGNSLHSASPSEMRRAKQTLAAIRVGRRYRAGRPRQKTLRVIADKGSDCDALRKRLRRWGIVLITPLRLNRRRTPPQDGRILRRYERRWIVERTFAWLRNFRHLVRYNRAFTIYRAFSISPALRSSTEGCAIASSVLSEARCRGRSSPVRDAQELRDALRIVRALQADTLFASRHAIYCPAAKNAGFLDAAKRKA